VGTGEGLLHEVLGRTHLAWSRLRAEGSREAYTRRMMYNLQVSRWRRSKFAEVRTDRVPETRHHDEAGDAVNRLAMRRSANGQWLAYGGGTDVTVTAADGAAKTTTSVASLPECHQTAGCPTSVQAVSDDGRYVALGHMNSDPSHLHEAHLVLDTSTSTTPPENCSSRTTRKFVPRRPPPPCHHGGGGSRHALVRRGGGAVGYRKVTRKRRL